MIVYACGYLRFVDFAPAFRVADFGDVFRFADVADAFRFADFVAAFRWGDFVVALRFAAFVAVLDRVVEAREASSPRLLSRRSGGGMMILVIPCRHTGGLCWSVSGCSGARDSTDSMYGNGRPTVLFGPLRSSPVSLLKLALLLALS